MILLVSEKFFKKYKKKLVKYKDFAIGDSTDRDSSKYTQYNHATEMREFNPTPKLLKIASDPKSEESKVYERRIEKHLDVWLNNEALIQRIVGIADYIVDYNKSVGQDVNVIIVLRKDAFKCYAKKLRDQINNILDAKICTCLNKDMEKDELREILESPMKKKKLKALEERVKKLKKKYKF